MDDINPQIINLLHWVPPKQDSNALPTPIGVRSYIIKRLEWAYFEEILILPTPCNLIGYPRLRIAASNHGARPPRT
jgi:hypothetical protein